MGSECCSGTCSPLFGCCLPQGAPCSMDRQEECCVVGVASLEYYHQNNHSVFHYKIKNVRPSPFHNTQDFDVSTQNCQLVPLS
ncbi:hypothetical protein Glove_812942g2 [Diversispora epigaea]|uniref:Uncharacterized protein n=1 Tax=Diversispora epigaea TaxID=1348612 RepID=A0A397G139_9GLOM|nr:hypothetical protein Glove_812942g2 [Diversispora epigaea]